MDAENKALMSKRDFWVFVLFIFIGLCVGLPTGSVGERLKERRRMMEQAVKNGHARYFLDAENERQWEWLPACKGK